MFESAEGSVINGTESSYEISLEEMDEFDWVDDAFDHYERLVFFIRYFLVFLIIVGAIANGLFGVLLMKRQLIKQYQFCIYLLAVSINNITELSFVYGSHYLYLLALIDGHMVGVKFHPVTCKLGSFIWMFTNYNLHLLMTGILLNRLMVLQSTDGMGSQPFQGTTNCCRLPTNPTWKKFARWFCTPFASIFFVVSATLVLGIANVPVFWFRDAHDGYCITDYSTWDTSTVLRWQVVTLLMFWIPFLLAYPVITPTILCCSGSRPLSTLRRMFWYSELDGAHAGDRQESDFTRLSLVSAFLFWIVSGQFNGFRLVNYLELIMSHRVNFYLEYYVDIVRIVHCFLLIAWPFLCLALVPLLRRETKTSCLHFKDLSVE